MVLFGSLNSLLSVFLVFLFWSLGWSLQLPTTQAQQLRAQLVSSFAIFGDSFLIEIVSVVFCWVTKTLFDVRKIQNSSISSHAGSTWQLKNFLNISENANRAGECLHKCLFSQAVVNETRGEKVQLEEIKWIVTNSKFYIVVGSWIQFWESVTRRMVV